jgi:hypothetical protein
MKASVPRVLRQNVKVNNLGGALTISSPITLKNQVVEINSIQDIADVDEIDVVNGATLIYNSVTDKYEIKRLNADNLQLDLDGGSF